MEYLSTEEPIKPAPLSKTLKLYISQTENAL